MNNFERDSLEGNNRLVALIERLGGTVELSTDPYSPYDAIITTSGGKRYLCETKTRHKFYESGMLMEVKKAKALLKEFANGGYDKIIYVNIFPDNAEFDLMWSITETLLNNCQINTFYCPSTTSGGGSYIEKSNYILPIELGHKYLRSD